MEFCENCNNMLYVRTNEDKHLVKYCRHCENTKIETVNGSIKISESIYSEDDLLYHQNCNKYLRYDPSLRRINDPLIKCTNQECLINTGNPDNKEQQVIYIKYHHKNMKYLYCCDYCGHIWR